MAEAPNTVAGQPVYDLGAYKKTEEYREIAKRHERAKLSGSRELLVIEPVAKVSHGGWAVWGDVFDSKGNYLGNSFNKSEGTLAIPPHGTSLDFAKAGDLKWIYMITQSPAYHQRICYGRDTKAERGHHQFRVIDDSKASEAYSVDYEQDVQYKNKIYQYNDEMVDFLCMYLGIEMSANMSYKKAALCGIWDLGRRHGSGSREDGNRVKLKAIIDSPDIEYMKATYYGLQVGDSEKHNGFWKSTSGVFYHNEENVGNSLDHIISYLKTHDEVFIALKRTKKEK